MFPLLQLGPLAIQVPGLLLLIAMWIAVSVSEKEAVRRNRPPEPIYGLFLTVVVSAVLGAKLGYVGRYLDTYLADPLGLFSVNSNTFDAPTGLIIAAVAALIHGYLKKIPLRSTLDIFTPGFAIFFIGVGFSHLSSGDAFGAVTSVPWAIDLWDASRHPTQIYEIILAAVIFALIWQLRRKLPFPGFLFLSWVSLTAVSRLFLEAFRGDSIIVADTIRQPQLAALGILLASLWLMRQWIPQSIDTGK